ncbi:cupin domain-containing protein [Roseomonas sp. CCTCC AB2023176]|uniref:cupin domain-containing protein n=1 Tax=Roseomonas sp. CCTCC AB2023176 TaxID=3342640 RepID=UPI0035DAA25D
MTDLRDATLPATAVAAALGLSPHPEGGHYRETWRDAAADGSRGAGTSILFLLAAGERSHWHRVDAAEAWHWHAGAPLRLRIADGSTVTDHRLGPDLGAGETLFGLVPTGAWQAAESLGAWTLVACTVSPAFRFEGFKLAPPGWEPPGA